MHNPLDIAVAVAGAVLGVALLIAIQPIPEVAFILQCAGLGSVLVLRRVLHDGGRSQELSAA